MFEKIAESRFRKVVVAVLLIVFAVVATVGGIKYYRYKSIQPVLQSKTYQTAVKLMDMERYPKAALTREQALKLLPVVRELAVNPLNIGNDTAKNQALLDVLNSDQKDFLNYSIMPGRRKNSFVEINKSKSQFKRDNSHNSDKGRQDKDRKNWVRRPGQGGEFFGRSGIGAYDDLLTVLLQKAYS